MKYLDHDSYEHCLREHFGSPAMAAARLAGVPAMPSGYYDIVRFFGRDGCDPRRVSIRYDEEEFCIVDPLIANFAKEMIAGMTEAGRLYSGAPAMHAKEVDLSGHKPYLRVQPCDYALQAGSCFALDYRHEIWRERGETLRQYYLNKLPNHTLNNNPLATCLGVCAWLTVRDGSDRRLVLLRRAGHLASLAGTVGPTVAGSVDFVTTWTNLHVVLIDSLRQEAREELGLTPQEFSVIPLAYGREIFRGERPQLLALIESNLGVGEMAERLAAIPSTQREFDRVEFTPVHDFDSAAGMTERLNHEGLFNLLLCQEYVYWMRSDSAS
ncbi:MAG: hypothetical protein ABIE70_12855 [bacterium]